MKNSETYAIGLTALAGILAGSIAGCKTEKNVLVSALQGYTQVERIGRPAINEGLFSTNAFLNTVNSIPPTQDAAALTGAVATEAIAVIDAVDTLGGDADDYHATTAVAALIPDVLRIDTSINSPVGTAAYANGAIAIAATAGTLPAGGFPRPVAGRKLEDDAIDITLQVLQKGTAAGANFSDNVSYAGTLLNPANPTTANGGHKLLNGQAAANGTATFPFLPAPN